MNRSSGLRLASVGQPGAVTSVGTTGTASGPSPANITYTSSTGSDQGTQPVQQQQQALEQAFTGKTSGSFGNAPPGNAQQSSPFTNTFSLGSNSASNSRQQASASGNQQVGPGGTVFSNTGGNQTFGGGAIIGVASVSKDPTIRVYNQKKTYNEWVFIYNPMDNLRPGVLLRGPYRPTVIGGAQVGIPAGQLNQSGQGAFGQQPSGFNQPSSGFGQQQSSPQQNSPVNQFPPDQNQQH
jgi:hypothetical protein